MLNYSKVNVTYKGHKYVHSATDEVLDYTLQYLKEESFVVYRFVQFFRGSSNC